VDTRAGLDLVVKRKTCALAENWTQLPAYLTYHLYTVLSFPACCKGQYRYKIWQVGEWCKASGMTLTNLTKHKKGPYISGIKIYNHWPHHLKKLEQNLKHFAAVLKRFLYHHSFYSINEYLEYKESK